MAHNLFFEGLAAVNIGDSYGFIDKAGKYIINPLYDNAYWFSEGLAAVEQGDYWGYIDSSGNFKIAAQFEYAGDFFGDIAYVYFVDGTYGYIDKTGSTVWRSTANTKKSSKIPNLKERLMRRVMR